MWKALIAISVLLIIIGILFVTGTFIPKAVSNPSLLEAIFGWRTFGTYLFVRDEHKKTGYILWGFSAVGLIIGIILRGQNNKSKENYSLEQNKDNKVTKNCPFCANDVKAEAIICQFCGKDLPNEFIPTHKVRLITKADGMSLRKEPNSEIEPFEKIPNDTEVQHLAVGEKVSLENRGGYWYKIKDNLIGWCFSGSLEKV